MLSRAAGSGGSRATPWPCLLLALTLRQRPPIPKKRRPDLSRQQDQITLQPIQEIMQVTGDQAGNRAPRQRSTHLLDPFQRRHGAAQRIAPAELRQMPFHLLDAQRDAARKRRIGQQKPDDVFRFRRHRRNPAERVVAGGGAQHGVPLRQLRQPLLLPAAGRAQQVILDVEQPGRLVGPLDQPAEFVIMPAFVAKERALGDAGMGLHTLLDAAAQAATGGRPAAPPA